MSTAIRVENLSKRYLLGLTHSNSIGELVSNTTAKLFNRKTESSKTKEFWALKDVSFEIQKGQAVGIIGRNGAGKSTLLKLLSRITSPTEGRISTYGRTASLLEVGTGFHPELTGRENIFLNGTMLGMTKSEINSKLDEIIEFSGIEKFIDTPVKRYSSGMYVRLGFAVAAHLEPEILIIDEVLAVGDADFQKRCLGKMDEVTKQGRTVLFVSHNLAAVRKLCENSFMIENGTLAESGETSKVVARYLGSDNVSESIAEWPDGKANEEKSDFYFTSISTSTLDSEPASFFSADQKINVDIDYRIAEPLKGLRVGIKLTDTSGMLIFDSYDTDVISNDLNREKGDYRSRVQIPGHLLSPGRYFLSLNAGIPRFKNYANLESVLAINVTDINTINEHFGIARSGVISPKLAWTIASN